MSNERGPVRHATTGRVRRVKKNVANVRQGGAALFQKQLLHTVAAGNL